MENPNYPYIRQRLKKLGMSQGDIARALGISRQAVNYGLRIGTLSRVQSYVADLLGEPPERLFPPKQKTGPKPKSYWDEALHHTGDLAAIEALFNRTAWAVPDVSGADPLPVMGHVGRVSKEFADVVESCAKSLEDGRMDKKEIDESLCEVEELIVECIRFRAVLRAMRAAAKVDVPRPARRKK